MKDTKQQIIIKKVKKVEGGGHHGGSWKVAYADFVTAMMAFFLLLWLITMVSPEKRARVAQYFKYFSLFEKSGTSFMEKSSAVLNESGETSDKVFSPYYELNNLTPEALKAALKQAIETLLSDVKDQIMVMIVDNGVKIEIVDKNGSTMFQIGSTELTKTAKHILNVLADKIKIISNPLYIEGHTDAYSYSTNSHYSNWELSSDRANAARRYLESVGIDPERIVKVIGYADKNPLIKENPHDPRNRRISITVLFKDKKHTNKG